jgi:uncharacterized protein YbaR (Trm112 family)
MIIFGWGHQTIKQIGVVFKKFCDHCHNEEYWILTRTITWFTLFFIPVVPYSIKYFLSCPVCKYGFVLDQEKVSKIKPLAEINQLLIDGKITNEEHQIKLNQLMAGSESTIETKQQLEPEKKLIAEKTNQNGVLYCNGCGIKLEEDSKFCSKCGKKI